MERYTIKKQLANGLTVDVDARREFGDYASAQEYADICNYDVRGADNAPYYYVHIEEE